MTNLADIRKQYPQYAKVPDAQLVEGLRKKLYPNMSPDDFNARIGYAVTPASKALTDARAAATKETKNSDIVGKTLAQAGQGMLFGFGDELNGGLNYAKTAIANATGHGRGYSAADAYHAGTQATREQQAEFHNAHPNLDTGAQLLGGLASPGVGLAGRFVARGGGLLAKGAANTLARSALAGGAVGAVTGAGNAQGGLLSRLSGAGIGGAAGMAAGGVLPVAAAGAGAVANKVVAPVATAVVRTANRASGGKILNPAKEASKRVMNALLKDKVDPATMQAAHAQIMQDGGVSPSVMDVVAKASPIQGQNTIALMRGAAMTGSGRGVATKYASGIVDNLQDRAIARTRALSDNQATAAQHIASLDETQGNLASQQYAEPYATPVQVTPQIASAIADQPGQAAVSRAMKAATARRDYAQADDLRTLQGSTPDLSGLPPAIAEQAQARYLAQQPPVSAGALDRVRIALNRGGEQAQQSPATRDIGAGLFGRAADVDAALEAVPGLAPARSTFAAYGANRDATELGAQAATANPNPADFVDQLGGHVGKVDRALSLNEGVDVPIPDARQSAGVGYRDAAVTRLGSQPDGASGVSNRLTNTNSGVYQDAIFGPEAGQSYRNSLENMTDQLNIARSINPNDNSRTAMNFADANLGEIREFPTTPHRAFAAVINKIRSGAGLTDDEREALTQMGTSQKPEDLDALLEQFLPPPQRGAIGSRIGVPGALTSADLMGQNQ